MNFVLTEQFSKLIKIPGRVCLETDTPTGIGVTKAQGPGMEHLTPGAFVLLSLAAELVYRIVDQGMAHFIEMDPDLVGPSRFQGNIHQAGILKGFFNLPQGECRPSGVVIHCHHLPFDRMTAHRLVNPA